MSSDSIPVLPIALLVGRAHAAFEQGRIEEADRIYAEVLERDPTGFEALRHFAMRALAQGHAEQAVLLFERAHAVQPTDPGICRNHGIALRASGRHEDALFSLREAVRLDPDFFAARLQLGEVCEKLGRARESVAIYFGAVTTAQRMGHWLNDATTTPSLRPLVRHAIDVIDQGRARLFGELLAPLRDRHGAKALARVEKSLSIYLGSLPANWPDPRQKPTFLYFADLPTVTYFDRSLFPWYEVLERRVDIIGAELESVIDGEKTFEPFHVSRHGVSMSNGATFTHATPKWDAYFFYRHGERYEDNCRRCPDTAAALDSVPVVRLPGHAPECLYSKLTPGTRIEPHRGVTNTRVVTHLPLIVPGNGALIVGGEAREWERGRCMSFDDTFLHEARNNSERVRVVLLLDTWNPYMTDIEIAACSDLVMAISGFNRDAQLADPMVDQGHG